MLKLAVDFVLLPESGEGLYLNGVKGKVDQVSGFFNPLPSRTNLSSIGAG